MRNWNLLIIGFVILLVLGGGYFLLSSSKENKNFNTCLYKLTIHNDETNYDSNVISVADTKPFTGSSSKRLVVKFSELPDSNTPSSKENLIYLFTEKIKVMLHVYADICVQQEKSNANEDILKVDLEHTYCTNSCNSQTSTFTLIFDKKEKIVYIK